MALPFIIPVAASAGLIVYAQSVMRGLSEQTTGIVDLQANRLDALLHMRGGIADATIMDRNMLLKTVPLKKARFRTLQQTGMTETREASDQLLALADTPERRTDNATTRGAVEGFFKILDRVYDLGMLQQKDEAFRIARDEGIPARLKINVWMQACSELLAKELAQRRRTRARMRSTVATC